MKFQRWPVFIVLTITLLSGACLFMAWIAIHNPPELVETVDEWK